MIKSILNAKIAVLQNIFFSKTQKNANITERHNERQCVLAPEQKFILKKLLLFQYD